jgi:hypothetical protein
MKVHRQADPAQGANWIVADRGLTTDPQDPSAQVFQPPCRIQYFESARQRDGEGVDREVAGGEIGVKIGRAK